MAKDTKELLDALQSCEEFKSYRESNADSFYTKPLTEELEQLRVKAQMTKGDVFRRAQISDVYGYQVFSGKRHPERAKLLRLLLAMGATLSETQDLLKRAGYAQLYARNPADSALIFGICRRMTVVAINDLLFEYDLPLI